MEFGDPEFRGRGRYGGQLSSIHPAIMGWAVLRRVDPGDAGLREASSCAIRSHRHNPPVQEREEKHSPQSESWPRNTALILRLTTDYILPRVEGNTLSICRLLSCSQLNQFTLRSLDATTIKDSTQEKRKSSQRAGMDIVLGHFHVIS